jgi:MYXO-CTERM domain-containing protein
MKRTCLISSSLALAVLAPTVATAEPAILYIPTDPVTLYPLNMAPCGATFNSALGCGGVDEESEIPPFAGAGDLTGSVSDALAVYDVLVTNTRPPEYISYIMLLANDEPSKMGQSYTCTSISANCSARPRNDMGFISGTTMNCMDPEITHAAVYAFGRASGLEGIDNPEDWMNYVPDYTVAPMGFQDVCSDRIQQNGFNDQGDPVVLPLECTSADHAKCPDDANGDAQQNSHQDLLLFYGERTEDTEAPVLANIVPEDGAVLMQGDSLVVDVDITDADPVVGVRWVVSSPALEKAVPGGALSQCTNGVCDSNWPDALPLKPTDSDWAFTLAGLPEGEYTITLEAADYHGNVAEMVTYTVMIGEEASDTGTDETGSNDTGNPPLDSGNPLDSGDSGDSGGSEGGANDDSSGGGCSCRTSPTPGGAVLMLLGLMGLGTLRRRW